MKNQAKVQNKINQKKVRNKILIISLIIIESGDKNDPRVSFLKKVNLAKITYDYADEAKDAKPKAERLSAINDLIQLLNDQRTVT